MCFLIQNDKSTPKIAKKDIICYKVGMYVDGNNFNPFFHHKFEYIKGIITEHIELTIKVNDTSHYSIRIVSEGYHSYMDISTVLKSRYGKGMGQFIIPKGATYYENANEFVSSQLIYVGMIKDGEVVDPWVRPLSFWDKIKAFTNRYLINQ